MSVPEQGDAIHAVQNMHVGDPKHIRRVPAYKAQAGILVLSRTNGMRWSLMTGINKRQDEI